MAVEVVVVVAGGGHDIYGAVGDADQAVALLLHIHGVGVAVVPAAHHHVVGLDGRVALGVRQGAPEHGLLAKALYIFNIVVGEGAELLHHLFLGIAVLVGADVHALAAENGLLAFEVFAEQAIDEGIGLGLEEIQVVHAIFLRAYLGFILREGQRVGGHVNFGDNLDAAAVGQLLQGDKLGLAVRSVLGGQTGIGGAFQTEGGLRLVPVVAEVLTEAVVVEVHLQGVHLIVAQRPDQVAQVTHGEELAAAIDHEAAHLIGGGILCHALGQAGVLARHLQQGAGGPLQAAQTVCLHLCRLLDSQHIGFVGLAFLLALHEGKIAGTGLALDHGQGLSRQFGIRTGKHLGHHLGLGATRIGHASLSRGGKDALGGGPLLQLGHDKRFLLLRQSLHGREAGRCAKHGGRKQAAVHTACCLVHCLT